MALKGIQDLLHSLPKRTVKLPADYYDARVTAAKDLAFTVSGIQRLDAIQAILDSLDANIKAGGSFGAWKKRVEAGEIPMNRPAWHTELVFRNHAQTAYAHGRCRNFEENRHARPYLMYSAVGDSRTRPAHMKMDGIIRPVGDAFWAKHMPPNGHNCRCSIIALSERQAQARGGVTDNPPDGADEGWGYSPCKDRVQGERKSLERKRYHPKLMGFMSLMLQALDAVGAMFARGE
jgi:SPP1 gp7 family putative phage head morphogenesis protein